MPLRVSAVTQQVRPHRNRHLYRRHGLHDNSWVNVSNHIHHMAIGLITRASNADKSFDHLPPIPVNPTSFVSTVHISNVSTSRFYPNGQVLSLLANEEHTPQQIIPLLKPTLRMKVDSISPEFLPSNDIMTGSLYRNLASLRLHNPPIKPQRRQQPSLPTNFLGSSFLPPRTSPFFPSRSHQRVWHLRTQTIHIPHVAQSPLPSPRSLEQTDHGDLRIREPRDWRYKPRRIEA